MAVLAGAAIGVALIIAEFAWLIITLGVIAVAIRLYLLYRRNVSLTLMHAAFTQEHERQRIEAAEALAGQRRHELAVAEATGHGQAQASAALMAPLVAAIAVAMGRPEPFPQPEPVKVRAEVVSRG